MKAILIQVLLTALLATAHFIEYVTFKVPTARWDDFLALVRTETTKRSERSP